MRILHIAHLNNELCSGVCVVIPQHIQAQQQLENVAVINLTNTAVEGAQQQFEYNKPFSFSALPEPFSKPDVVVFHEIYRFDYVGIARQLRKSRIPYVIIPHGSLTREAQRKKWLKKLTANFLFFNAYIEGAVAIQFLSENEKEESLFGKKKFVGTNGINVSACHKEHFSHDGVKLLYIGSLFWRIKGLDFMLSAIGSCADTLRQGNVSLEMFGPFYQDKKAEVQKLIQGAEVTDFVFLNDAIVGEEKVQKLLDCDIFIQTSRSEGMPMGILEALSYGLPCLVTEGTNLGELIRRYDAGWVAQTDTKSIEATIRQAIRERHLWIEKSKNARRLIEDNFMWEHVAADTLFQYNKMIVDYRKDVVE